MTDRDVEVVRSRARFVATLRRVADALEQHEAVRVRVAGKRVLIPASARLSIEHEVQGRDAELELQLSWQPQAEAKQNKGALDRKLRSPAAKRRPNEARHRISNGS